MQGDDYYARIAYVGVIVQAASALLLAVLFLVLRRFASRRTYLRDWSISFVGLAVAITALLVHYASCWPLNDERSLVDGTTSLARTCFLLYQAGKLTFFAALVTGAARFAGHELRLRKTLIVVLGAYAIATVLHAVRLDAIVFWQTPVGVVAATTAALLLYFPPASRRTLGTRITATVCLLLAAVWAAYAHSFDFARSVGALEPVFAVLTRYNSFLDVVLQSLLTVGIVMAFFQDLEREAEGARAERAALQARLAESRHLESLGVVVSGVAHDLNNPLTAILGFSEELAEPSWPGRDPSEAARIIHEQAQRCRSIVRDLLYFSRPRPPVREPVAPAPLIERVARGFAPAARKSAVSIEVQVDPQLAEVPADATGLEQVLANLIENAIHASPCGGTVRISAHDREGDFEVFVEDEGAGIPRDVAARIFEPYFTTKPSGMGSGLGLAVSRRIVNSHGGTIRVEPRPDRSGSRFVVMLPRRATDVVLRRLPDVERQEAESERRDPAKQAPADLSRSAAGGG